MRLAYRTSTNAKVVAEYVQKPLDKPDWYTLKAAKDGEPAELLIYDYIGWPYNDAFEVVSWLSDNDDVPVLARINSPGGDVWDGTAILNAIFNHSAGVTTRVESVAASMASAIAMGGKTVQAFPNTLMMIHNSMTFIGGNKEEMRDTADFLEKVDSTLVQAYTTQTKLGKKKIKEMMTDETWMTAKEMKADGFIDEIIDLGSPAKAEFNLSMFLNTPDGVTSFSGEPTIRDMERALRDAGVSRSKSLSILAGCREQLGRLDDGLDIDDLDLGLGSGETGNTDDAEDANIMADLLAKFG